MSNLKSTETDMMISGIANPDKLISEKKQWHYDVDGMNGELDEEIDRYTDKRTDAKRDSKHDEKLYDIKEERTSHDSETTQTESSSSSSSSSMSNKEKTIKKLNLLRKLVELTNSGVKLSQNYNLESDLEMMEFEYELHKSIRSKQNGINWMNSMCLNAIWGFEVFNDKYNPFDIDMKGWSEQVTESQNEYSEIFGEIYEKYNAPGKGIAPELKLLLLLTGSGIKYHITKKIMTNQLTPLNGEDNQELMEFLRHKATNKNVQNKPPQSNNVSNERILKEHNEATQRTLDMQLAKQYELNKQREKQQMDENKTALDSLQNNLKTNLGAQFSQTTITMPPAVQKFMKQKQESLKKKKLNNLELEEKTIKLEEKRLLEKHQKEIDRLSKEKNKKINDSVSIDSRSSMRSVVKMNKDFESIIDTDSISLGKKSSRSRKTKAQMKSITIM